MERAVEACLDDSMSDQSVKGVTCVDATGLCLDSRGTLKGEGAAAAIAELARLARKLDTSVPASPGQTAANTAANMPVVSLESEKTYGDLIFLCVTYTDFSRILITQSGGITIGVHRMS